ncbi:trehalose-phosphatase [Ferrimicrobium sp.]|uniref:trehalose-phosphatase n=1 Tax=Ferrimicrobium sp. TaxID=2926050 RepID=UPI0026188889|nr:trehalose-phosphatase [Ferrimicrobium sp.]
MLFAEFRQVYLQHPTTALLVFDFDGTLAPIVSTPGQARLDVQLRQPLERLSNQTNVIIISGRPTDYLEEQFAGIGIHLIGNYGRPETLEPTDQTLLEALVRRARQELPTAILVEEKPSSLALHYRRAPDRASEVLAWSRRQEREYDVALDFGKSVVEVSVGDRSDKGTVLRRLAGGHSAVLYAGDDVGDIPAMKALQEFDMPTCGLAIASEQSPTELSVLADESISRSQFVHYLVSLTSVPTT